MHIVPDDVVINVALSCKCVFSVCCRHVLERTCWDMGMLGLAMGKMWNTSVGLNYGHFRPKTLWTLDTSALVWWVRTVQTDWH